jgi:hypothetical protein
MMKPLPDVFAACWLGNRWLVQAPSGSSLAAGRTFDRVEVRAVDCEALVVVSDDAPPIVPKLHRHVIT